MNAIAVRRVSGAADIRNWLDVPRLIFEKDPAWVQALDHVERRRLSRRKNPFFKFADVELFVAYRGSTPVGRISAQVNGNYLARHNDATGQFGFFDTIDDPDVAKSLISTAVGWLAERGMRRMCGPFNFSINEECGILVDGFDVAPAIMMPHSARWQGRFCEGAGLVPEMDMYAFRMNLREPSNYMKWLTSPKDVDPRISVRSFNGWNLSAEFRTMVDIFNDAWQDNWGFVPLTAAEIEYMIGDLRPFFRGSYGKFVCVNDEPVGFGMIVPNVNDLIQEFRGRLLPLNWLKLASALAIGRFYSGRNLTLGLKRSHQGSLQGPQLLGRLIAAALGEIGRFGPNDPNGRSKKVTWLEFSWILASNRQVVAAARSAMGEPIKTYRLYSGILDKLLCA